MSNNELKAKLTLAGVAVGAAVLAFVSFAVSYWHQRGVLEIIRVVEVAMCVLLLFGIFGAEVRHKAIILLAWLVTTIVFCITILFILDDAYVGDVFYVIISEFLLVGMMYIVYRAYCEVDQANQDFGWTQFNFPRNLGLSLASADLTAKKANNTPNPQPPPYEEQNVPNVAVY